MEDTVGKLFGSWLPPTALAGLGASGPGCPRRDRWKSAMEDTNSQKQPKSSGRATPEMSFSEDITGIHQA